MKKLWLTYAWKDNEDKDIDFIVKSLDGHLLVKFDRRNLIPGQRLWSQIGGAITDPAECDAWAIILTPNSIQSQPCIEELSYALDRALSTRSGLPMIALMHKIPASALPPPLKIRLCVALSDPRWLEHTIAAAEGRPTGFIPDQHLTPFVIKEHHDATGMIKIEIRPRFDTLAPVMIAVERHEFSSGTVRGLDHGPAGFPPWGSMFTMPSEGDGDIGSTPVHFWQANNEASPHMSYYVLCKKKPARLWFGRPNQLREIVL